MKSRSIHRLVSLAAVACVGVAAAQEGIERNARPDERVGPPAYREDKSPRTALPPPPAPAFGPSGEATDTQTFELKAVEIYGNTRIATADIEVYTGPYVGRRVSIEDLSRMRDEVTKLYVSKGYVSSGAVLPPQDARSGVIKLQIIEGVLEGITVEGAESLDAAYLLDRFDIREGGIVNLSELENRFRVLLDDPAVKQVDADLRPGKEQGRATIVLRVRETDRFAFQLTAANERSPSIGGDRGAIEAFLRNLVWSGDFLTAEAGVTEGTYDGRVAYSVPLSANGLLLTSSADYSHAKAIEEPVNELDILSESIAADVGLLYPLYRDDTAERAIKLTASAAIGFQHSETSLSGVPFSFSPGAVEGTTEYWNSVLGLQYVDRGGASVFAAGIDVKFGLDAVEGATSSPATPDPNFWVVAGRAQYARRLDDEGLQVILRADGQYADNPMFVAEKYAIGGLESVRGYRKNRALGDSGLTISAELQRPILETGIGAPGRKDLALFAFVDAGQVWNAGSGDEDVDRLSGAGGGIAWTPTEGASVRLTYAYAIDDVPHPAQKTLQDEGVYFQVTVRPMDLFE